MKFLHKAFKYNIEGLESEWLLTNFTGETKQNFDHASITCIINLKPQTLQPQAYLHEMRI